jgi:hypothetical protein
MLSFIKLAVLTATVISLPSVDTCSCQISCANIKCAAGTSCQMVMDDTTSCETPQCVPNPEPVICPNYTLSCDNATCPEKTNCELVEATNDTCQYLKCSPDLLICPMIIITCDLVVCGSGQYCEVVAKSDTSCAKTVCLTVNKVY